MKGLRALLAVMVVLLVVMGVFLLRNGQETYQADELGGTDASFGGAVAGQENSPESGGAAMGSLTPEASSGIPLEELSQHASRTDCWIAYDSKVYDVTSYLPRHPGGTNRILPYCGTAEGFTKAFEGQHGTSKVSTLMKMGTFIGDFDVVGSLESPVNPTTNAVYSGKFTDEDDDEDDD